MTWTLRRKKQWKYQNSSSCFILFFYIPLLFANVLFLCIKDHQTPKGINSSQRCISTGSRSAEQVPNGTTGIHGTSGGTACVVHLLSARGGSQRGGGQGVPGLVWEEPGSTATDAGSIWGEHRAQVRERAAQKGRSQTQGKQKIREKMEGYRELECFVSVEID